MDNDRLRRTLQRIAHEIVERHSDQAGTVLVGIRSRGVPLARRLASMIRDAVGVAPPVGALDITLYRDDLRMSASQPTLRGTDIPVSIDERTVILVDDVLFTGRSVRGALDELIDFGRPARIELAVVVDRGHRELPIRADYVGGVVSTAREDIVQVLIEEEDGQDAVVIIKPHDALGELSSHATRAVNEKARKPSSPRAAARRRR
ncbi:MAG: bifunctional pyr operon transcriptional regulator/uracil phosphoribosyltransferase PyrR [Vicinamibacteria bacterium]|nr:bifunctional pyr operon transcriptional regulator/uracil phosphoribosyltransferase PyrR [Vicinamibacteria bacterium]